MRCSEGICVASVSPPLTKWRLSEDREKQARVLVVAILFCGGIISGAEVFGQIGELSNVLRNGLLRDAGSYGEAWFGQLMAGPQMLAWLVQLNQWMERFNLTV